MVYPKDCSIYVGFYSVSNYHFEYFPAHACRNPNNYPFKKSYVYQYKRGKGK